MKVNCRSVARHLFSLALFFLHPVSTRNEECYKIDNRDPPVYRLIRVNGYSEENIISRRIVSSLRMCKEFAASKKALAFNIGLRSEHSDYPPANYAGKRRISRTMCFALQCPETSNLTTLRNSTRYDYYSMYPVGISLDGERVACVPNTGIFLFPKKSMNYTEAQNYCEKFHGSLAHAISEERTNGLAKFISPESPTFVGLSSNVHERIWKNAFGESLSCFEYRAWGVGEPSNSRGCVGLVKARPTSSTSFWKVLPCKTRLPFICEISPFRRDARHP